jgi:hypothetical protein
MEEADETVMITVQVMPLLADKGTFWLDFARGASSMRTASAKQPTMRR